MTSLYGDSWYTVSVIMAVIVPSTIAVITNNNSVTMQVYIADNYAFFIALMFNGMRILRQLASNTQGHCVCVCV